MLIKLSTEKSGKLLRPSNEVNVKKIAFGNKERSGKFILYINMLTINNDDEFRFNDASTHEDHLRQNGIVTWFGIEKAIMVSQIYMKNI